MNQTSIDNRRPAQLIVRHLEHYPHATLWGFPIPYKQMIATFNKTAPPNVDQKELMHLVSIYTAKLFARLRSKCNKISLAATNGPEDIYARDNHYGEKMIFSLVKSTHHDDTFIPSPDKVEELKKIFAEEGFTDEPGWFRARD